MPITRTKVDQSMVIKHAGSKSKGVCLTLCRRWVKAKMDGTWAKNETVYDLSAADVMNDVLAEQKSAGTMADKNIEGLSNTVSAKRTGGGLRKFKGLRKREDVINHVLAVPGAFIYVATEKGGGGHAFAFDTRDRQDIVFFDPNQGEWNIDNESSANILQWWKEFWDASGKSTLGQSINHGEIDYKKAFTSGDRELWLYDVPA